MDANNRNTNGKKITCDMKLCELPLAMAYVPFQKWCDIYNIDCALTKGTLFAQLDLPFMGKGAV